MTSARASATTAGRAADAGDGAGPLQVVPHWIGGKARAGTSGRRGDVFDPATGQVARRVDFASAAEVDDAVAEAAGAFAGWRATPLSRRSAVLFALRELFHARAGELAAIVTAEHGKVLDDAAGEVGRALEVVEFACGIPHLLKGSYSESVSSKVDSYSIRQPLGVVAVVSPFNFPAMVPCWFVPIAIAAGNAVVLKPSEKDPSAANWMAERWSEAGLPDGVFSVVHGDEAAVDALIDHPGVRAVSFVGSTPVARAVYERATGRGKRVQALGGAKNHMVVLPDADLDLAADAAVNAGFGSAGERCMAVSVVVAVEPIGDALVAAIAERVGRLRVGDGRGETDMGPLVTAAHRDKVASYLDAGVSAGAAWSSTAGVCTRRAMRGASGSARRSSTGSRPTCRSTPTRSSVRCCRSSGHPPTTPRSTWSTPTPTATGRPCSPTTAARRGASRPRSRWGWSAINVPIPVPMAYYSFGGWKSSLFGDAHAHGTEGVSFFTRGKVVTSRWLDPDHGGLDLGFPST